MPTKSLPSKSLPRKSLPRKSLNTLIIFNLLLLPGTVLAAGELSTLFTTPQERQLINANR